MPRRVAPVILVAVLALAGCGSQRPLHVVLAEADNHRRFGRVEQSVPLYEEFVTRRPEDAAVRARLAQAYLETGRPRDAINQLIIASDVDPLNEQYLDLLATAFNEAGEREGLIAFLQRAASERGGVSDYLRLGRYSAKIGNVDEAQQALLTAAKLDRGRTWEIQKALADFYGSVGDRRRQIDRLRMTYFLRPGDPDLDRLIRELGEIPGPTFGIMPLEARQ